MSELEFRNLTVRYGLGHSSFTAVESTDLVVPSGRVVGLVGESGSGKSTIGKAAVGLSPISGGEILLDGLKLDRTAARQAGWPVQMVFQDPNSALDPRMTIGESISEALRGHRFRASERRNEVAVALTRVGLEPDWAKRRPGSLSGGQRQRVGLARALAAGPKVLIADEVTSALDVSVQGAILNLIRELQRELGLSVLFISHNLAVVRYLCDIVAVMYQGRIVEYGPVDRVLSDPQHPYTRSLLAAVPDPDALRLPRQHSDPAVRAIVDSEVDSSQVDNTGCPYRGRCLEGPLVTPSRRVCSDVVPDRSTHRNAAACHFADSV